MGSIRKLILAILGLALTVSIALFGRLPIFRRTPIGFCHRAIWIHMPRGFKTFDKRLTGGRLFSFLLRAENYLMNEKHPIVLIFFFLLLSVSQILFVPPAWSRVPLIHHLFIPAIVCLTYGLLWLGWKTPSSIVAANHATALRHYPYDHTLYHPGLACRTCQFTKPARSKHCPICKTCISKADHHCVWLNNCVGRNNYVWFLALLFSVSIMLVEAVSVGYGILDEDLQRQFASPQGRGSMKGTPSTKHWSKEAPDWSTYFQFWSMAIAGSVRIGAVTLLSAMSFPLSTGLFLYHVYLIWAGMTTNESAKWTDWRDDINDGLVWRARREDLLDDYPILPPDVEPRGNELDARWDGQRDVATGWWVIRMRTPKDVVRRWQPKQAPAASNMTGKDNGYGNSNGEMSHRVEYEPGEVDERWHRVNSLEEIVNVYDLGFWGNVWDIIWNRDRT